MQYQKNWTRPMSTTNKDENRNYYAALQPFDGELTGSEYYRVKLVYCYSIIRTLKVKKVGDTQRQIEVTRLILQVKDKPYYFTMDIWGARRRFDDASHTWTEWGDNPAQMQDFLYLVQLQKGDGQEVYQTYTHETEWEEQICYPNMCGAEFILLAAQKGIRAYGSKCYPDNEFALFAPDGHSALELQEKAKTKNDIKLTKEKFEKDYQKFSATEDEPQTDDIDLSSEIAGPVAQAMVNNDDLPF